MPVRFTGEVSNRIAIIPIPDLEADLWHALTDIRFADQNSLEYVLKHTFTPPLDLKLHRIQETTP